MDPARIAQGESRHGFGTARGNLSWRPGQRGSRAHPNQSHPMRLISANLTKRHFLITIIVIFIVLFSIYVINTTIMKNSFERQIKYRDNMIAATLAKKIEFSIKKMVNDVKFVARYVSSHGGKEVNWSSQEIQDFGQ